MAFNYFSHSNDGDFEDKVKDILLYHKIVSVERLEDQVALLTLDNGTKLKTIGNDGCGGCSNGWFYVDALNQCDNAITNVECVHDVNGSDCWTYHIYVYADDIRINCVEYSGYDNGYYGTGYHLFIELA